MTKKNAFIYISSFRGNDQSSQIASKMCHAIRNSGHELLIVDSDSNKVTNISSKKNFSTDRTGDLIKIKTEKEDVSFITIIHDLPYLFPIIDYHGRVRRVGFCFCKFDTFPLPWFNHFIEMDEIWVPNFVTKESMIHSGIPGYLINVIPMFNDIEAELENSSLQSFINFDVADFNTESVSKRIVNWVNELDIHDYYWQKRPVLSINCRNQKLENTSITSLKKIKRPPSEDYSRLRSPSPSENIDDWITERKEIWSKYGPFLPTLEEFKKLEYLKNKYYGNRIFVIGNGPSLNKIDFKKLKNEYTFGVNKIYLMSERLKWWYPTFYTCIDWRVVPDAYKKINTLRNSIFFFPYRFKNLLREGDDVYWYFARGGGKYFNDKFDPDILNGIPGSGTVLIPAIQIAYYLGFREIYLIGVDANFKVKSNVIQEGTDRFGTGVKLHLTSTADDDPNHFDPSYFGAGAKWHDPNVSEVIRGFEGCRKGIEVYGGKIYNATIGGKLEVLERVDFNRIHSSVKYEPDETNMPIILWLGRFASDMGYGVSNRNFFRALSEEKMIVIGFDVHHFSIFGNSRNDCVKVTKKNGFYSIQPVNPKQHIVVVLNETPEMLNRIRVSGRIYFICCTVFETESIPQSWIHPLLSVDEIWTHSFFNQQIFAKAGIPEKKIKIVPHTIDTKLFNDKPPEINLKKNSFTFLSIISNFNRKDIGMLLRAYYKTFTSKDDVSLIIKFPPNVKKQDFNKFVCDSVFPDYDIESLDLPHVLVLSGNLSLERLRALQASANVTVSIERGKGWDLPAMESMAFGIPVIGIAWSANLSYMTEKNSFLVLPSNRTVFVDEELITNYAVYSGHTWSTAYESDISNMMSLAYTNYDLLNDKSALARLDIHKAFNFKNVIKLMRRIIDEKNGKNYKGEKSTAMIEVYAKALN